MKIATKIGAGFGAVITLLIVTTLAGIWQLSATTEGYSEDVLHITEQQRIAALIPTDLLQVRRSEKDFIARDNFKYAERARQYLESATSRVTSLRQMTHNSETEILTQLGKIESQIEGYAAGFESRPS